MNIGILLLFMRAEREISPFFAESTDMINNIFDDVINGIDVLKAFNRVDDYRSLIRKNMY